MSEQSIKPVAPTLPARDVIKKEKAEPQKKSSEKQPSKKESGNKKGIIDTYA